MKKTVVGLFLSCDLLFLSVSVFAQSDQSDSLLARVVLFPVETVYLHCDKQVAIAGERIYWTAYVFEDGAPSSISTDLYADLFSREGRLIAHGRFPIRDGLSLGELLIPDSVSSGGYRLRAYTKYQLNFDSTHLFRLPIAIFNRKERLNILAKKEKDQVPEPVVCQRDSLLMVSTRLDTGLVCHLSADAGCAFLGKSLDLVMVSNHQPVIKASFCLSEKRLWQDMVFSTKIIQGVIELLLLSGKNLIARQTIDLGALHTPEIRVSPDTVNTFPGGYNSWTVNISDFALYNCSVSVTDADKTFPAPTSILRYQMPDPFDYEEASRGHFPVVRFADTSYLAWRGMVSADGGKPVKDAELITVLSNDSSNISSPTVLSLDGEGRFELNNRFFYDSAWLSFQLNSYEKDPRAKKVKLSLDTFAIPSFRDPEDSCWRDTLVDFASLDIFSADTTLPADARIKELPAVVVKSDVRKELDDRYTRGIFSEKTPFSYDLRTDKRVSSVWAYLRKNLLGFEGGLDIGQDPSFDGKKTLFYVDNQLQSVSDVENYWYEELAYVKAFPSKWIEETPFMKWVTGFTGFSLVSSGEALKVPVGTNPAVICIYTRKGTDIRTGWAGLERVKVGGYSRVYHWSSETGDGLTLFWAPLQKGNNFDIRFYNRDAKRFRISIEGVSQDGKVAHLEKVVDGQEK